MTAVEVYSNKNYHYSKTNVESVDLAEVYAYIQVSSGVVVVSGWLGSGIGHLQHPSSDSVSCGGSHSTVASPASKMTVHESGTATTDTCRISGHFPSGSL
jgi:hypothetical protein